MAAAIVTELHVRDFRTMHEVALELGPVCALIGEAQAGKSNLLAALHAVLVPEAGVEPGDVRHGRQELRVRARLAGGAWLELAGRPPSVARERGDGRPPAHLLAARDRVGTREAARALAGLEEHLDGGTTGAVILVEEPELYLRPQAQRWCARLLRMLADNGNQVVYSTHSPAFLNVARLDELVFVERRGEDGTRALRPPPLPADEEFRALSEFDAERAELFLARAALLVEGRTEKLAMPFVFAALGEDADRAGISIVECGGVSNLALFARVCRAAGVPFVVLHDRDAPAGRRLSPMRRELHAELAALAGRDRLVELAPDFEAVSGLRGAAHKPERAWRRFATLEAGAMPRELVHAARLTLDLATRAARDREQAMGAQPAAGAPAR